MLTQTVLALVLLGQASAATRVTGPGAAGTAWSSPWATTCTPRTVDVRNTSSAANSTS